MRPSRRRLLAFAGCAALVVFPLAACGDDPSGQPCNNIPVGGCPLSHGVACEDPTCDAVYACSANTWSLVERCPVHEAGAPHDTGIADAPRESANVVDAAIDAPPGAYGGPGCIDLEMPDCPLGVALACTSACCGCDDLYVCTNGGWTLWGTCGPNGPTPR